MFSIFHIEIALWNAYGDDLVAYDVCSEPARHRILGNSGLWPGCRAWGTTWPGEDWPHVSSLTMARLQSLRDHVTGRRLVTSVLSDCGQTAELEGPRDQEKTGHKCPLWLWQNRPTIEACRNYMISKSLKFQYCDIPSWAWIIKHDSLHPSMWSHCITASLHHCITEGNADPSALYT